MDLYRAQNEGLKLSINGLLSQEERALAGIRRMHMKSGSSVARRSYQAGE